MKLKFGDAVVVNTTRKHLYRQNYCTWLFDDDYNTSFFWDDILIFIDELDCKTGKIEHYEQMCYCFLNKELKKARFFAVKNKDTCKILDLYFKKLNDYSE